PARSPHFCSRQRALRPCRPQKLRRPNTWTAVFRFIEIPPPDPSAPGIFRLAKSGELAGMLQQAGFADISDDEFLGDVRFPSADTYFSSLMDIAAPIQNLWTKLSPAQQKDARQRILDATEQYRKGSIVALPIAVRIITARKPT
ncbi:MAG: hypothetical protein OEV38_20530, partial [Nitrospira sp.]|nr:hypothetical protein [Nitrospira sp.]